MIDARTNASPVRSAEGASRTMGRPHPRDGAARLLKMRRERSSSEEKRPADRSTGPYRLRRHSDQMRSGKRMMNMPAVGIFTFGSVCAFITSFSSISLLIASR
jgi:hypothetical protein